jgi:hypothetical protein
VNPTAHYLWGHVYGQVAFSVGFIALLAATLVPGWGDEPPMPRGVRLLADLGVPLGLCFPALFFGAAALAVGAGGLTRWAFRRLVPAHCPRCGGRAYGQGDAPVTYLCWGCGHRHDTGLA